MQDAVVIHQLDKKFGPLVALNKVSLTVKKGAFFALLGPNGAGKTTLIGVLGGLIKADRGDAWVLGKNIREQPLETRKNLGIVPQEVVYDSFFTVRESLVFQSKYYGINDNRQWIDALLAKLRLTEKEHTNTRQLSGGMKRRLMIAQALVHRPPVIVLDEPTAGVDINMRLILWDFIRDLNRQGHTIILTTHYLEEAETLCNTVALMQNGAVVALDETQKLLRHFHDKGRVRLRLLGDAPPGIPAHQKQGDFLLFTIDKYGEIENLLALLRKANVGIAEIKISPPDLESVFLRLLGDAP